MNPDPRLRQLRRLDHAARSKPAEKRPPGAPDCLVQGTHSRGYLPHVKVPGASYFVTFRLADSLPQEVLAQLRHDAEESARIANAEFSAKGLPETAEPTDFLSPRIDGYLDAGHGACWLRRPEVADLVAAAIRFFEGQRYHLHAWVVMPNHVHAVLRPTPSFTLSSILHSWKSFTSKAANKLLGRNDPEFWQRETFDRWCRDEDEVARWHRYVIGNPVAARLCAAPEAWHWSSAYRPPG
jgi:REP element-mobilizing transposase RayT